MIRLSNQYARLLALCTLGILTACTPPKKESARGALIEKVLSFYNPYTPKYSYTTWIRKPQNIRITHETLKKYGYQKLFTDLGLDYSENCGIGLERYVHKPCANLIDTLIQTYLNTASAPKYYKEFWQRRKAENNDTTVYAVLKEIRTELAGKTKKAINPALVNDTLLNLVRIRTDRPTTTDDALRNFEYLKLIGLHKSAYHLLYQRPSYSNIPWNKGELSGQLKMDTLCCPESILTEDYMRSW
jgi:hypothetical protein